MKNANRNSLRFLESASETGQIIALMETMIIILTECFWCAVAYLHLLIAPFYLLKI